MPGPFDELEKEAENLEKQSKEEFTKKNYVFSISLLEEAKEIYSKLGYQGKIGMINNLHITYENYWNENYDNSYSFNFFFWSNQENNRNT